MTALTAPPRLVEPTEQVRVSSLVGEQADCVRRGIDASWLAAASIDVAAFAAFAAERRGVRTRWGVPSSLPWWVSGEYYLGSVALRHHLTPALAEAGGHMATTSSPRGSVSGRRRGYSPPRSTRHAPWA